MSPELPALIADANAIAADAERIFGPLNGEQLNWRDRAGQWSVAQCFEHLIKINDAYAPQWRLIEQGAYAPTWRDRVPWLAGLFGSLILRAVQPESPRKFKAAHHVEPSTGTIDADIIARFLAHQQDVVAHMTMTGSRDLRRVMVTSAVAPIAFYSALDAFRILVAHERRHMAQAQRVIKADGFPERQVRDR